MTIIEPEIHDLATPYGPMRTFVYRPVAPGRYPGIILYSEIFQVTGPISRTAAFLAGHGFVVAVPEIFHELETPGAAIPYDQAGAERGNSHKTTKELASYDADAVAAAGLLKGHPACTGALGTLGICIGGHLSFRAAIVVPEIRAAVCFYATDIHKRGLAKGKNDDTLARCGEIKAELLMIWGRQDPHIPREGRQLIYHAINEAQLNYTWHEFNGQHAFIRDEGYRYDPALQFQCYTLALELFNRRLHLGDQPLVTTGAPGETRH
jgi:carboxymethylenebutenolidase